jgi:tetratricopeptide (TPR) repeat protein
MIQILLACALASLQEPGQDAKQAVDALLALKEDDEEGRDLQTDKLLRLGEKALDEIEKRLESAQGVPAFRLRCVRDMIWYPIDVKAAYTSRESDSPKARSLKLEVGDIYLSFNGQRVNGHMDYSRALRKAESEGLPEAVVEVLQKGRRRTVKIPGLRLGGYLSDYPHDLAVYVHRGHRGPAWDDQVAEALAPGVDQRRNPSVQKLASALRLGCRDVLVLTRAMWGLMEHGKPEEAKELWQLCRDGIRSTAHSKELQADCWYIASRACLECGDVETATSLAEESVKRMQGPGFGIHRAFQKGWQGVLLQEQDPARALELLRTAVEDQRHLGNDNLWLQMAFIGALKRESRWAECSRQGWIFDAHNFNGYSEAPYRDSLRLMGEYDRPVRVLIPRSALFSGANAAGSGPGNGLMGEYFGNETFQGTPVRRIDPQVNFDWGEGSPHPSIPNDHFSIRWTGLLEPPTTGLYTFTTRTDDGVRLWVDGKLIIDHWVGQPATEWSGTLDLVAGKKVDLKMEYFEGAVTAVAQLFWSPPGSTGPEHWALVYRQNFEVPEAGLSYFESATEEQGPRVADGRLIASGQYVRGMERGWSAYEDVRVEADLRMLWDQSEETVRGTHVGLSACLNSARRSEAGSCFSWPRDYQSTLYGENGTWWYQPRVDLRKTHRLAIEVRRGKIVTTVDGRWVNTQVLPAGWSGSCGLRQDGMPFECDNFEVYVPADAPGDVARARGLYDRAATDFKAGRIDAALGDLEEAAALQPRTDDLGRLYAAYLRASGKERSVLWKRLEIASARPVIDMLLEAEVQFDLLSAPAEQAALCQAVHRRTLEGEDSPDSEMKTLGESGLSGPLSVYLEAVHARGGRAAATVEDVVEAYEKALRQAPESRVLALRFAKYCLDQRRGGMAESALKDLMKRLPRAEFLKEWVDGRPR